MRVLEPCPGVLAFYDGRIPGRRLVGPEENWLDDGAYELGIASYAIVDGSEALVYDTHISLDHAGLIRRALAARGVTHTTVVLSHWHADHVAGNATFTDCEIIANAMTRDLMVEHRDMLEQGSPPIRPLVMPTRIFDEALALRVGGRRIELCRADAHSIDGTVLLLPDERVMMAGDTLEDPITYVVEPERLTDHLVTLRAMRRWPIDRILPNHGDPDVIAAGGFDLGLIDATIRYVERLLALGPSDPTLSIEDVLGEAFASGAIRAEPAYAKVHSRNVALMRELAAKR